LFCAIFAGVCIAYSLLQGGAAVFWPRAKHNFLVGPKGEETLPGTIIEKENGQFPLSLTAAI
jgi:hypothetical protein